MSSPNLDPALLDFASSPRNRCFACGPGNPVGLQLQFEHVDGAVRARFIPNQWHEGWAGVVHGGVVGTLIDEAMAYALFLTGQRVVTARLELRYRAPAQEGDDLCVEARVIRDARRLADVEARVLRGETVIAEGSGRFAKLGLLRAEDLFRAAE